MHINNFRSFACVQIYHLGVQSTIRIRWREWNNNCVIQLTDVSMSVRFPFRWAITKVYEQWGRFILSALLVWRGFLRWEAVFEFPNEELDSASYSSLINICYLQQFMGWYLMQNSAKAFNLASISISRWLIILLQGIRQTARRERDIISS